LVWFGETRPVSKKKTRLAKEADPVQRANFQKKQKQFDIQKLVFLDEFSVHTGMNRSYARSRVGERAAMTEAFEIDTKWSVISALSLTGVDATLTIEGAIDGEVFQQYVQHFLCQHLRPGNIVVMDNVKFHHNRETIRMIESTGARVVHLPPYSPDFNPIEECISKIKAVLKKERPATQRKLGNSLRRAINRVSPTDILGWFEHCGYSYSRN
jgi:transposase